MIKKVISPVRNQKFSNDVKKKTKQKKGSKKLKPSKKLESKENLKKEISPINVQKRTKEIASKKEVEKSIPKTNLKLEKYIEAVGRRKTAIARVRIFTQGEKTFLVNEKLYNLYFLNFELQQIVIAPLEKMNCLNHFRISAKIKGGGLCAQAVALRHGISRALVSFNPNFRKRLRIAGYLTRDSRMRERKKFGLKRARKAPQWQKR